MSKISMSKISKVLGTLLVLVFAGAVQATSLSALLGGGSLTVGDKLFDNWGLLGQGLVDTTGQVDLSLIEVTGSVSGSNVVLRFDAGNELSLSGINQIELPFGYRVSVLPGSSMNITSVAFNFMSGSFGQNGIHAATEDIFDSSNNALGHIYLEASNSLFQVSGTAAFNPVDQLFVEKSILLSGFATGDSTSLNWFTQTYSQQQIPEPGALALLGLGLAGLAVTRRQKQSVVINA